MAAKGEGTREQILHDALELFRVNGFAKTSLRQIAEKVGISKPALYYHFDSKDDLLLALVEPISRAVDELLERAETAEPPLNGREFFSAYFDMALEHRDVTVWMSLDNTARAHPELSTRGWKQQERLIKLIRGDDDSFERSVQVACALGAMQVGIMTFATFGGLDDARQHILESALSILEKGGPDV